MKIARILALIALPLALAAGCSSSSSSKAVEEVLVEGSWRVDRYLTELRDGTVNDMTATFNGYRYTFYDDGFVVSEGKTGTKRGIWGHAERDGQPTFGIQIPGTPMFFGRNFVWWVEEVDDGLVTLMVEDPHISVTRLVFAKI